MASKAPFDFKNFAQDHQVTSLITGITDLLKENADDALSQKIKDFKEKFKLPDGAGEPAPFKFDLATETYEDVPKRCAEQGKNLKKCTYVQADRFFVSKDFVEDGAQQWIEVASPSTVDIHQQSAQLSFLDSEKKLVDWPQTLSNLNNMIKTKLYSDSMMQRCLLRMINHYESGQTEYLKDKTSDEIARFLLSLDSRVDKIAFHKSRLANSARNPEETLSAAVIKIRNIVDKLYALPAGVLEHESNSVANRVMINAIISFMRDELALPLLQRVQIDSAASKLMYYTEYLAMAVNAELRSQIYPTTPLKYGRKLSFSPNPLMTLNNIEIPVIHPCLSVPKKKTYLPRDLSNYFGLGSQPVEENIEEVTEQGDAAGFFPGYDLIPEEAQSSSGARPLPAIPGYKKSLKVPAKPPRSLSRKSLRKSQVPTGTTLFTGPQGVFFYVNNEKIYVDDDIPSEDESADKKSFDVKPDNAESTKKPENTSSDGSNTPEEIYEQIKFMSNVFKNIASTANMKRDESKDRKDVPEASKARNTNSPARDTKRSDRRDYPSRPDSRDRPRSFDNRRDSRDRGNRNNSRDRPDFINRDRQRTNSRERNYTGYRRFSNDRGQDRNDSNRNRNFPDRNRGTPNQSPNRDNYYRNPNRSPMQSYSSDNRYRRDYSRSPSRNNYPQSSDNRQSRRDYNRDYRDYRNRTSSPQFRDRRDFSRDRSRESRRYDKMAYNSYPSMKKGYNCSPNYNPILTKSCSKCSSPNTHHEFECRVYTDWNENKCTLCSKYNHYARSCQEIPKFPPKNADNSNINLTNQNGLQQERLNQRPKLQQQPQKIFQIYSVFELTLKVVKFLQNLSPKLKIHQKITQNFPSHQQVQRIIQKPQCFQQIQIVTNLVNLGFIQKIISNLRVRALQNY